MKLNEITRKERWLQSQGKTSDSVEKLTQDLRTELNNSFDFWSETSYEPGDSIDDWVEIADISVENKLKKLKQATSSDYAQETFDSIVNEIKREYSQD